MLRRFLSLIHSSDDDLVLDHVPVQGKLKAYEKKLAKARERHGKEFRTNTRVYRVEPPSHDLQELEKASKATMEGAKLTGQIENITRIERKEK